MDRILSRRIRRGGGVRIWLFYRRKCKYSPSQGRFKIPRPHGFVGSTPTGATALRRPGEQEIKRYVGAAGASLAWSSAIAAWSSACFFFAASSAASTGLALTFNFAALAGRLGLLRRGEQLHQRDVQVGVARAGEISERSGEASCIDMERISSWRETPCLASFSCRRRV
jgi:hypothetical protein